MATLLSLVAHGTLLGAIALEARGLPPAAHEIGALRFSGQTFDVDAVVEGAPMAQKALPSAPPPGNPGPSSEARVEEMIKPEASSDEEPPPKRAPEDNAPAVERPPASEEDGAKKKVQAKPPVPRSRESAENPSQPGLKASVGQVEQSGDEEASTGQAYGEEATLAGRSDLFQAFLRSLPAAAKGNPAWLKLAPGWTGSIRFKLILDEKSKLQPIEILTEPNEEPPDPLRRAVLLTRQFLLHGRLALSGDRAAGEQELRLRVEVSDDVPDPNTPNAEGPRSFGRRGPSAPDRAFFDYYSGRNVELFLERR